MTIAKMLAIRRDLESGYHKFKQIGQTVYHTLDGVNWVKAFILPDSEGASTVTNNSAVTNNLLWKSIVIGDQNNLKPEDQYTELKMAGAQKKLATCNAIRSIVYGVFVGFYQQFVKEYIVNETAALTEQQIKGFLIEALDVNEYFGEGSPVKFLGDASVFLSEKIAEFADEYAMFFDETFYGLVSEFAFILYNPDITPKTLIFDELVCDIAESLNSDESYANFGSVAGTLPLIVYEAWENFASRDIWRVYLFLSRKSPNDATCPCGENCYSIPPSAMIVMPSPYIAVSATRDGDWLRAVAPTGLTAYKAVVARTFYPFGTEGKKVKSIHVTFHAGWLGSGSRTPLVEAFLSEDGITFGAGVPGYPLSPNTTPTIASSISEYTFNITPTAADVLFKGFEVRAACTYVTNNASYHAIDGILKSVIICTEE